MESDLRTRLIAAVTAARPVSRRFVAGDGYMSVAIRSDEEAAAIAADAVIRELEADYILVPKGHTIARIRSAEKLGLTGNGE